MCGLAWNEEKTKLASGGNDNYLCIWDVNASTTGHHVETMALAGHTAAVKVRFFPDIQQCYTVKPLKMDIL